MDLEHEAERRFICEYLNLLKPLKPEVDVSTATHILLTGNPDFAGLSRYILPAYLLDFGPVVLGKVACRRVHVRNPNSWPIGFAFDRISLTKASRFGFNLSSPIRHENLLSQGATTLDFVFDPSAAKLDPGHFSFRLMAKINNGPQVPLILTGEAVMPQLIVSQECVNFGTLHLGQARLITIQLSNPCRIRVAWADVTGQPLATKVLNTNAIVGQNVLSSSLRGHRRYSAWENRQAGGKRIGGARALPPNFEIVPISGSLDPGEKRNIQIKFVPSEGRIYSERLFIQPLQSVHRICLSCQGEGLEPRLDFSLGMIEFRPVLPECIGDERNVIVTNPCSFPIEFYSSDFDPIYKEEDEILRHIGSEVYDQYGHILLPPREPGKPLPPDFITWYRACEAVRRQSGQVSGAGAAVTGSRQSHICQNLPEEDEEEGNVAVTDAEAGASSLVETKNTLEEKKIGGGATVTKLP
ncbi:unnamed protein product [Protopolystoma xenopodis]|uniref:MSP domain-containing protein n=1 Tax=Protopolystoma xenopodis TaxID=117903 RepID=A0A3S5BKT2_9PLAT|nr:unnamed protein product [Protopolystoma xenopodis]